jgi:hypothetical protein
MHGVLHSDPVELVDEADSRTCLEELTCTKGKNKCANRQRTNPPKGRAFGRVDFLDL